MHTFDERLVINKNTENNIIYNEHLIRYELAKRFAAGKVILDIACGSGYGAKILAQAGARKVIAIDTNQESIESAKKNYFYKNIEYKTGRAKAISLDENSVDIAVSFETIEHLESPEKFLSELARVVKDDGLVIISTPNKEVSRAKNPFHLREFAREEFKDIIKKHFNECYVAEQGNGIASYVTMNHKSRIMNHWPGKALLTNKIRPDYFIAFCGKRGLFEKLPKINLVSVNPRALQNLYNNPGLRVVNKIYALLVKVPGVKAILRKIKDL